MVSPLTIFFLAFTFAALELFLLGFQEALAVQARWSLLTARVGFLGGLSILDLISYLLFPLVFFTLSYFVGRGIDVRTHYFAVAFSLFVGGASGTLAGTVAALYYLAIAVPIAASPVTSPVEPFFVGFTAFFSGFSAIALSNFRMKNE